jgi:hypothetical protein
VEATVRVPEDRLEELRELVATWCKEHHTRVDLEDTTQVFLEF